MIKFNAGYGCIILSCFTKKTYLESVDITIYKFKIDIYINMGKIAY